MEGWMEPETHQHYGNDDKEEFQWMRKREKDANILYIILIAKLLNC
jgi:hypothetical protein